MYIAFGAPGTICLIADNSPPWGNTGGSVCGPGIDVASKGIDMMYQVDPKQAQAVILVPDSATATIDRGTFIAAGNGVIGVKPASPQDGVAVTLNFPAGHKSHFDLKPR